MLNVSNVYISTPQCKVPILECQVCYLLRLHENKSIIPPSIFIFGINTVYMSVKTYVVDLKKEKRTKEHGLISSFLAKKIEETLQKKEQVILFLNKRGHTTSLLCKTCGYPAVCTHCDISLTEHRLPHTSQSFFLCHFCGAKHTTTPACTHCGEKEMLPVGSGTQHIEELLHNLFPHARILRMDADSTRLKGAHSTMYTQMKHGHVDIIIGTQLLAKGLDIPGVSLVGILQADQGLHIPDFRASEKVFQLLMQVMGRASRRGQEGTVVIQTYIPEHPLLQFAAHSDYEGFYTTLLEERRTFNYPPFSEIIKCIYVHKDQRKAYEEAKRVMLEFQEDIAKLKAPIECYLAPAFIKKQYDKFHYHVLLKGTGLIDFIQKYTLPSGWKIDVDPMQM